MKNAFCLSVISLLVFFLGCKQDNPVSAIDDISYNSVQKSITGIPAQLTEPFNGSFQSSGFFSNIGTVSTLELFGNGTVNTLGKCKIFSHTKITSTAQLLIL